MAPYRVELIALATLKPIITFFAATNDAILFSAPWVVSPSANPELQQLLPSPLLTTLAYAVLEPLWTRFFLWLPWPVFPLGPLLIMLQLHAQNYAVPILCRAVVAGPQTNEDAPSPLPPPTRRELFGAILWPIQVVAVNNAALLIIFRTLPALPWEPIPFRSVYEWGFLGSYLANRKYEGAIARSAAKPSMLDQRPWEILEQLPCLVILFGTKMLMRVLLGVDPWIGLRAGSVQEATQLGDPARAAWLLPWVEAVMPLSWQVGGLVVFWVVLLAWEFYFRHWWNNRA